MVSSYGVRRKAVANAEDRYLVTWRSTGTYAITVLDNGEPVVKHPGVPLFVDRGSRLDFACPYVRCAEVAACQVTTIRGARRRNASGASFASLVIRFSAGAHLVRDCRLRPRIEARDKIDPSRNAMTFDP